MPLHSPFYGAAKGLSIRLFFALDAVGIHLLPKHYHTPVPDFLWLRRNGNLWQKPVIVDHTEWDLDQQLQWLHEACNTHYQEVAELDFYNRLTAQALGPGYGPIESQVLHCFIRKHKPRLIVEVGAGVSTATMAHAAQLNASEGYAAPRIIAIEPNPGPRLLQLDVNVVRAPAQAAPSELFDSLERGDLLFIDSSHSLKTGSELHRLYLQIIPYLSAGVFIHIHDIMLPFLYGRRIGREYFDWQETSLVLALLTNNERLGVVCCQSALHYARRTELRQILTDYRPQADVYGSPAHPGVGEHFPSSLWLVTR